MLETIDEPTTADGLWNKFVFLNATSKDAYDRELINFAIKQVNALQFKAADGSLNVGPRTFNSSNTYKKYLNDMLLLL